MFLGPRLLRRRLGLILPAVLAIGLSGPFPAPWPLSDGAHTGGPRLEARELSGPLREAGERLRAGDFAVARQLAESVHRLYPKDIEAMLLLGEIEIAAGRPEAAKPWFAQAAKRNRHHPLVTMYQQVIKELEHRRGPLPGEEVPSPSPADDKTETADRFKRGWFGTGAVQSFPKVAIAAKPGMASFTRGIFLARTLEEYAREAVQNRRFLQAYLYFTELMDRHPEVEAYRIGKAETALEMGRGREARSLLLPLYVRHPDDARIKTLLMRCIDLKGRRDHGLLPVAPTSPTLSREPLDRTFDQLRDTASEASIPAFLQPPPTSSPAGATSFEGQTPLSGSSSGAPLPSPQLPPLSRP